MEKGYPADTPIERMTAEQRANFWSDQAKKHEAMLKAERRAIGNITAADIAALRDKAANHDALERELMSDKDKAVAQAADDAKASVRSQYAPRLVAAEFKAAAAGRIEADRLATLLEPLDLSKFLNGDDVDTDKVAAFVNGISPAVPEQQQRRGPSASGAGNRSSITGPSLSAGSDAYARRHKKSA